MRVSFFLFIFILSLCNCQAQEWVSLSGSGSPHSIKLESGKNLKIQFDLHGFNDRREGNFNKITVPHFTGIDSINYPDLPKYALSLIVPENGIRNIKIIHAEFTDFRGYNIRKFKRVEERVTNNQTDVSLSPDNNSLWPQQHFSVGNTFKLHELSGQVIYIYPFEYNNSDSLLRVYTSLTLEVEFDSQNVNQPLRNRLSKEQLDYCRSNFANFELHQFASASDDAMLILCPQQWLQFLQPLADWKNQSGIATEIADVTSFANDAVAIKNYIYAYYQQHNLTHVLLVGDNGFIASPASPATAGPSDPSYGYLSGSDSYPEVYTGRFPAETDSDVITMVQRVLEYEKEPDTTADWFSKSAGIASNLGPGDDNEMDWEHLSNIRDQLLNYNYTSVAEMYDGTHPSTTDLPGNPSSLDVVNAFQSGISLLNYTGHGAGNSFNTSGFSVNEIVQLTNTGNLPVVISAGCANGNFTTGSLCMGEAFLRARSNGEPVGAVAAFMSAVNQYWNPPMDAQDAMNAIITENDSANASHTFGGIVFGGCMQMNDHYGNSGFLMTDTWHCFGDPSLLIRTAFPIPVTATHAASMTIGDTVFNISSNVQDAVATLFQNGKVISKGLIAGGSAQLAFSPVISSDSVLITISGYNLYPYIYKINVLPAAGSYVICTGVINDDSPGNNNGFPDYHETVSAGLTFYNAGLLDATSLQINVMSSDSSVTIQSINPIVFNLNSGDSVFLADAFEFKVSSDIKDGHEAVFNIIISDSSAQQWSSSYEQTLNAPALISSWLSIDDQTGNGNGVAEANENVNIKIRYINAGHSDADSVYAKIATADPELSLLNDSVMFSLSAQEDTVISFPIHIASTAAINQLVHLSSHLQSGAYVSDTVYNITTGYVTEGFESASLSTFNWQFSGNELWFITSFSPAEGSYCVQSGDTDDNEQSGLRILINVYRPDSLKFYYKTDCESTWDYLEFRSDSISYLTASGSTAWSTASFLLDTGLHVLEFIYKKDNVFSSGLDAAWVDEIQFPPFAVVVGINEQDKDNKINAYPVPASNRITFSNLLFEKADLYIYDVDGRLLVHDVKERGMDSYVRDVSSFTDGFYMLMIRNDSFSERKPFIIQRQ